MEGEQTWKWMVLPLIVLTVNLFFPRSRLLKAFALLLLLVTAGFRAFAGDNEIDRSLRAIERWVSPGNPRLTAEAVSAWLPAIRRAVAWYGLDLWLGLALGILFASLPCDILSRWRSHIAKQKT